MKSLTIATVIFGTILAVSVIVSAVNVTYGTLDLYRNHVIASDHVVHAANWFSKHKEIVTYPPKGHVNFLTLSAISVVDHGGRKNFGYTTLISGGPGHRNATIEVKSQTRKPVNITILYFVPN